MRRACSLRGGVLSQGQGGGGCGTQRCSPFDEESARGKRAEGAASMESAAKARALARLPVRPEQAATVLQLCWREQPQCGWRDATLAYCIHQEAGRAPGPGQALRPPDLASRLQDSCSASKGLRTAHGKSRPEGGNSRNSGSGHAARMALSRPTIIHVEFLPKLCSRPSRAVVVNT